MSLPLTIIGTLLSSQRTHPHHHPQPLHPGPRTPGSQFISSFVLAMFQTLAGSFSAVSGGVAFAFPRFPASLAGPIVDLFWSCPLLSRDPLREGAPLDFSDCRTLPGPLRGVKPARPVRCALPGETRAPPPSPSPPGSCVLFRPACRATKRKLRTLSVNVKSPGQTLDIHRRRRITSPSAGARASPCSCPPLPRPPTARTREPPSCARPGPARSPRSRTRATRSPGRRRVRRCRPG